MALDRILVVDDEVFICKTFEDFLRSKRYSVYSAGSLAEAEKLLKRNPVDLIFLDGRLPDGNGIDLLERIAGQPGHPVIVMMSGFGTIASAVECMKHGAFDYLIKPFSLAQVEVLIKKVESFDQMLKLNQYLNHENSNTSLIGNSPAFVRLKQLIQKVAPTEATVLICGENGTGKELAANEIYNLSARSQGPYIKINCAAVAENLIESEFFGHEKGSYTGATERREGRFELANGGTLLLDEISEISPRLQAKLLRVLQEREFERVGGSKTIKVDVRVIATTNRDLKKAVEKGDFREDLYYRLNVFPIQVPPLRERKEDIALLAETFLERFARRHGSKTTGFSQSAMDALMAHHWPGNVRELQNAIERAVILAEGGAPIHGGALGFTLACPIPSSRPELSAVEPSRPAQTPHPGEGHDCAHLSVTTNGHGSHEITASNGDVSHAGETGDENGVFKSLDELEKDHILDALHHTGGNRTQAATLLKISIRTLRNKLNDYKLAGLEV